MLRVGIVGCGLIGSKRARVVADDPGAELFCTADVNVLAAGGLLKQCGKGTAYADWNEMLDKEGLDVLIVATPNKFLKKVVLHAAEKKMHVLCEKPLGRNAKEAARMVAAAQANGVLLKTGFNHRHHPAIARAHEMVQDGVMGDIYFARCIYGHGGRPGYEKEWRASKEVCGGGELLDQGVHVVDLFRWFMGDFEEAFGYTPTCYWPMEVEDNAFALFRTGGGQVASMHTSWTQWKNRFTFEVFGEAGYLIVDGLGGSYGVETLKIGQRRKEKGERRKAEGQRGEGVEGRVTPGGKGVGSGYAGGAPDEETMVFDGPDVSWELEWKEFCEAIREKREPLGSGRDGLEANRMIEAVFASARENRPVRIEDEGQRSKDQEGTHRRNPGGMRFENLDVWKRAARLSATIYEKLSRLKDFGFRDQITRASLSIPSNIAEGFERQSQKECLSFLSYAKGSCGELRTQIYVGMEIGYIPKDTGKTWVQETVEISSMLGGLIKTKRGFLQNA